MPEFDSPAVQELVERARTQLDGVSVHEEVDRVLTHHDLSDHDRAHLLLTQLVAQQGVLSSQEATARANEAVRLLRPQPDVDALASALAIAAMICAAAGDRAACIDHCLEMSNVIRSSPDMKVSARSSANFAAALLVLGAYDLAIPLFASAITRCLANDERVGAVFSCSNLAIALSRKLLVTGKTVAHDPADLMHLDLMDKTLVAVRATESAGEVRAFIDATLANVAQLRGDIAGASERWGDMDALRASRSQSFVQYLCLVEAPLAIHRGDFDRAHRLIEATLEVLDTPHIVPLGRVDALKIRSALYEQTGQLEAALADSREATALALCETSGLADLLISQVDTRAALELSQQALLAHTSELTEQTLIDELSQVGNRRAFEAHVEGLREGQVQSVSLVLFDIDCFKNVNDQKGHAFGDEVITRVGALAAAVAGGGRVFRYGGDEFVVVALGTPEEAAVLAERIRLGFVTEAWGTVTNPVNITCSVGIWSGSSCHIDQGLESADQQMYAAKEAGRNLIRPIILAAS